MSENKIDAFETGIFAGLSKLEEIRIHTQESSHAGTELTDTMFQDLSSLKEVYMYNMRLSGTLRKTLLLNTPNLVVFD
eukprot:3486411-Rhodomonas_salina.1